MHHDPDDLSPSGEHGSLVAVLRRVGPDDMARVDPPADLWDSLLAAVRAEADAAGALDAPAPHLRLVDGGGAPRRPALWRVAGIAAAAVLVVAAGAALLRANAPARSEVVASTRLATVADGAAGSGRGAAQLVERPDGTHLLVEVAEMSAKDRADFFELWLLDRSNGDPQSLGRMDSTGRGTLDVRVPEGVDTDRFPVVDISSEVDDGDATHSGRSVLRGTLS